MGCSGFKLHFVLKKTNLFLFIITSFFFFLNFAPQLEAFYTTFLSVFTNELDRKSSFGFYKDFQ